MSKHIDCVEMKYKAARIISKKLAGMTPRQQLKFWEQKHNELVALQKGLLRRKNPLENQVD